LNVNCLIPNFYHSVKSNCIIRPKRRNCISRHRCTV